MNTRLQCLIWGTAGVVFGLLAILFPAMMLATFYGAFLILAILAVGIFLFLAITSHGDESVLWFGLSAGVLIITVLSFLVQQVIEILFLLIIAGIAFYNGFSDVTLALEHPRTKYILIPGMFIAGTTLLAVLLSSFPALFDHLVIVILGNYAFVFGLVSILMGLYQTDRRTSPDLGGGWVSRDKACQYHKPGGGRIRGR